MKMTKTKAFELTFDFADFAGLDIAKKYGMKQAVHLFESALIALASFEENGNYSAGARNMNVPVTTLQSRKEVLKQYVDKFQWLAENVYEGDVE